MQYITQCLALFDEISVHTRRHCSRWNEHEGWLPTRITTCAPSQFGLQNLSTYKRLDTCTAHSLATCQIMGNYFSRPLDIMNSLYQHVPKHSRLPASWGFKPQLGNKLIWNPNKLFSCYATGSPEFSRCTYTLELTLFTVITSWDGINR